MGFVAARVTGETDVTPTKALGPVTQLIGTNGAVDKLIFRGSTLAMTLQGESACAVPE